MLIRQLIADPLEQGVVGGSRLADFDARDDALTSFRWAGCTKADSANLMAIFAMYLLQAQPSLGLPKCQLSVGLNVGETGNDRPHERAFLLGCFVVSHRLHHRHAAPATGEKHRPAHVCCVFDDPAGIDLQIGQRNYVLGELGFHGDIWRPVDMWIQ